jgi:hypothetical protein
MKPKTMKYIIEMTETDKGYTMNRQCEGFTALELMGVLEFAQHEIIKQMKGLIKPTIIKRNVIQP